LNFEEAGKFLKRREEKEQRQNHVNHKGRRGHGGKSKACSFSD
jgi:hypothetical protein